MHTDDNQDVNIQLQIQNASESHFLCHCKHGMDRNTTQIISYLKIH